MVLIRQPLQGSESAEVCALSSRASIQTKPRYTRDRLNVPRVIQPLQDSYASGPNRFEVMTALARERGLDITGMGIAGKPGGLVVEGQEEDVVQFMELMRTEVSNSTGSMASRELIADARRRHRPPLRPPLPLPPPPVKAAAATAALHSSSSRRSTREGGSLPRGYRSVGLSTRRTIATRRR